MVMLSQQRSSESHTKNINKLIICWKDSKSLKLNHEVKVEVNSSMCLINSASRHEEILGTGYMAPTFSTSTLDVDDQSASRPSRLISGEKYPIPAEQEAGSNPDPLWTS